MLAHEFTSRHPHSHGCSLKDSRKTRNLSLDALAEPSGVSRSMVSQIERVESSPTV
jgi:transcriptional regulator with XRE-family HTH domain